MKSKTEKENLTRRETSLKSGKFMKWDDEKVRLELIPPSALEAMGKILTFGAKKYDDNNWKKVDDPSRYVGAAMRHMEAFRKGEVDDPESGMPHLWHLMTNIAFLIELEYKP